MICDLHSAVGPALADLVLRCACSERPLPAAADPSGDVPGAAVAPRPRSRMRQVEQSPPPLSCVQGVQRVRDTELGAGCHAALTWHLLWSEQPAIQWEKTQPQGDSTAFSFLRYILKCSL